MAMIDRQLESVKALVKQQFDLRGWDSESLVETILLRNWVLCGFRIFSPEHEDRLAIWYFDENHIRFVESGEVIATIPLKGALAKSEPLPASLVESIESETITANEAAAANNSMIRAA